MATCLTSNDFDFQGLIINPRRLLLPLVPGGPDGLQVLPAGLQVGDLEVLAVSVHDPAELVAHAGADHPAVVLVVEEVVAVDLAVDGLVIVVVDHPIDAKALALAPQGGLLVGGL